MTFESLGLVDPILRALDEKGYSSPTPIQEQSIPILLKGKDLMGCAQTGTGKTAAFAIPIIHQLLQKSNGQSKGRRAVKALVVTPTRELALQIDDNFRAYAKHTHLRSTVIFGGVKQGAQTNALRGGIDILVATPGRLLDLMQQGFISLKDIEHFVLDEADQMLDMGFINDINKILQKLPNQRQSLFFSATMPKNIIELSNRILGDYDKVDIRPAKATADRVDQAIYMVAKKDKAKLLSHLLKERNAESALVFSRTKHGCDKVVRLLAKSDIKAAAIHGNKSQNQRQKALANFKKKQIGVLVATDIAARGIDISQLELVINYDLPNVPETYVHRIGRTGRANQSGIALSFCDIDEKAYLKDIQKLIKQDLEIIEDHPYPDDGTQEPKKPAKNNQSRKRHSHNKNRSHSKNRNRSRNQKGGGDRS